MRTRNIPIQVMLNEEEFRKLDSLSHTSGLSFSAVLRKLIMNETIRQKINPDFRSLARAIDRIGNNYNQIAHKVNATGTASFEDLNESAKLLREIKIEIAVWKKQWQ